MDPETFKIYFETARERLQQAAETIRDLTAERDTLLEDAIRYRKLRALNWADSPMCVVRNPKQALKLGSECPYGDLLDWAVDNLAGPK